MRILKIALISTGIGAIVVLLGSLVAAFASTQRGANALTRVITPLKVVFETFIGFLQDTSFKVFDRLKEAINDPKQAFEDLGEVIKNNIINRFVAIADLGGAVAKIFKGLIDQDFEAVGEGLEDAANASIKLATGLEDVVGSVKELAEETAEATAKALADGEKLANLEIGLEELRIRNVIPLAKQNLLYKQNVALANDQNTADSKRIKFLTTAEAALLRANELRKEEIQAELDIAQLKATFNDTDNEALLEIERIKERLFQSETEFEKKRGALISLRSGIEKRQATERRKDSIELINVNDRITENDKTNSEKRIAQDKKELDAFVEVKKEEVIVNEAANKKKNDDDKKLAEETKEKASKANKRSTGSG